MSRQRPQQRKQVRSITKNRWLAYDGLALIALVKQYKDQGQHTPINEIIELLSGSYLELLGYNPQTKARIPYQQRYTLKKHHWNGHLTICIPHPELEGCVLAERVDFGTKRPVWLKTAADGKGETLFEAINAEYAAQQAKYRASGIPVVEMHVRVQIRE
jgi:hypothetical protein